LGTGFFGVGSLAGMEALSDQRGVVIEYEAREETRADERDAEMTTEAILPLAEENIAFVSIGVPGRCFSQIEYNG
jgi:hypothetical protein